MSSAAIRVALADDHAIFLDALRALLDSVPDVEVVGSAASGEELLDVAARSRPDVALVDIHMAGIDGIEAARGLALRSPGTRVVMLTMIDEPRLIAAAMRAGARGYVVKGADQEEVLRVIRAVAAGEVLFGTAVADHILQQLSHEGRVEHPFPDLTEREREILELIARGRTNAQIAAELHLSVRTVRNYASAVFRKLQVQDRTEAMLRARDAGLGRGH